MTRIVAALLLALTLAAPAAAADRLVSLTLDGRPVDRAGGIALLHQGVIYADVVDLVKAFDGLLTFQGPATVVTINSINATFTAGSRTAKINDGAVTMKGRAFMRNGDLYVPLETFVTAVAKAKVRVDAGRTRADIIVNAPAG
ncbi:MAG: hypothetical protein JOZ24_00655 [Candidatus Eremiobacteraeota bacterium]|nr:hypothetical protein [Candidatus Eremiobacteraeota bacterium]